MKFTSSVRHAMAALVTTAASFGMQAHAATVTFEDVVAGGFTSSTLTAGNVKFESTSTHTIGGNGSYAAPYSGQFLGAYTLGSLETISTFSGQSFDLLSLDIRGWYGFGTLPLTVTFTGYKANATVSQSVLVSPSTFSTVSFTGFTNLTSVKFGGLKDGDSLSSRAAYVAVDNINITPVPEPETIAMLLAGLGVVGVAARRRKRA